MKAILLRLLLDTIGFSQQQLQDTIKVGPSFWYPDSLKFSRWPLPELGREDITFSPTKKRVEYCYYHGLERICDAYNDYEILNDSTLQVNDITWTFQKQENKYTLHRHFENTYVYANSKSLMPLEPIGPFTYTTLDKIDTLWTTYVDMSGNKSTAFAFHKSRIKGKVYKAHKVDTAPTFLNGDSILEVKRAREDFYYNEPLITVYTMRFVITSTGRIVNIEQEHGNVDRKYESWYITDLIRSILAWGPVKPAMRKGKPVNVEWIIHVDMINEGWDWRTGECKRG